MAKRKGVCRRSLLCDFKQTCKRSLLKRKLARREPHAQTKGVTKTCIEGFTRPKRRINVEPVFEGSHIPKRRKHAGGKRNNQRNPEKRPLPPESKESTGGSLPCACWPGGSLLRARRKLWLNQNLYVASHHFLNQSKHGGNYLSNQHRHAGIKCPIEEDI